MQRILIASSFLAVMTIAAHAGDPIFDDRTIFNPNDGGSGAETYVVAGGSWIDNLTKRRHRVRNTKAVAGVRG